MPQSQHANRAEHISTVMVVLLVLFDSTEAKTGLWVSVNPRGALIVSGKAQAQSLTKSEPDKRPSLTPSSGPDRRNKEIKLCP